MYQTSPEPDHDPRDRRDEDDPQPRPPLPQGIGRWLVVSLLIVLAIVLYKLYPFDFGPPVGRLLALEYAGYAAVLIQIAIFVPLGAAEAQVVRRLLGRFSVAAMLLVIVDAMLLSLITETAQYWLATRHSSLIDLMANILGAAIGYQLAVLLSRRAGGEPSD